MKALRIKKFDQDLKLSRFEIVLIKDIAFQKLTYFSIKNEANFDFKLHNGVEFLLRLPCDKVHLSYSKGDGRGLKRMMIIISICLNGLNNYINNCRTRSILNPWFLIWDFLFTFR
jgi:hypothetical protein